jgi:adenylate cyclase
LRARCIASLQGPISAIPPGADESLTRCVSDIRLALEDADQSIIKTMSRRGYVFSAPVSSKPAVQASGENAARTIGRDGVAPSGLPSGAPFSLVVLPFVNLTGDPTQDHLSDAITDGLTTYLSRIRGAFVIARSIAMT